VILSKNKALGKDKPNTIQQEFGTKLKINQPSLKMLVRFILLCSAKAISTIRSLKVLDRVNKLALQLPQPPTPTRAYLHVQMYHWRHGDGRNNAESRELDQGKQYLVS
jgi:hypothetical protein